MSAAGLDPSGRKRAGARNRGGAAGLGVQPREDEQIGIFARIFARIFVSSCIQFPHPSKIAEERWTLQYYMATLELLPCAEALNRGPGWRSSLERPLVSCIFSGK
eukprot:14205-Prymnesium_polylepis.1